MDASLPRTLPHGIRGRQLGTTGLREACLTDSLWRLALATSTEVAYPPRSGACNWLELDRQEQRYLLAAGGDGSVSVFDVGGGGESSNSSSSSSATATTRTAAATTVIPPLFVAGGAGATAAGQARNTAPPRDLGHRFAATCVCWYPVDSGAFVSGGADGDVKVWDANAALPVASFSLSSSSSSSSSSSRNSSSSGSEASCPRVMAVAMSPAAASSSSSPSSAHALIAVGAAAGGSAGAIFSAPAIASSSSSSAAATTTFAPLRLADARVGAFTHTLGSSSSHSSSSNRANSSSSTAAVWCVSWSPSDANQLLSGSADGTARAWDVRRADACVATLDLEDTRDARREERERRERRRREQKLRQQQQQQQQQALESDSALAPLPLPPLMKTSPSPSPSSSAYRRAHDAAITGLVPTPDGLSWVTSGADSAVRVWSSSDFALDERAPSPASSAASSAAGATFNRARRPRQLAASLSPAALFHPSGSGVQVLPLPGGGGDRGGFYDGVVSESGNNQKHRGNLDERRRGRNNNIKSKNERGLLLRGHVDAVHACCWCEARRELYTGGDDRTVLVWSATAANAAVGGEAEEEEEGGDDDDDDDDDGDGGFGFGERPRRRRRRSGARGGDDEDAWSD